MAFFLKLICSGCGVDVDISSNLNPHRQEEMRQKNYETFVLDSGEDIFHYVYVEDETIPKSMFNKSVECIFQFFSFFVTYRRGEGEIFDQFNWISMENNIIQRNENENQKVAHFNATHKIKKRKTNSFSTTQTIYLSSMSQFLKYHRFFFPKAEIYA